MNKNPMFTHVNCDKVLYKNSLSSGKIGSAARGVPPIRTPTPSHRNLVANVPGVTGDRACGKIGSAARGVLWLELLLLAIGTWSQTSPEWRATMRAVK